MATIDDDFDKKAAAITLLGKKVKLPSGATGTVTSMDWDGNLAVDGNGCYEPSQLTEEKDRTKPDFSDLS
jgi:hypothetical protein